MAIFSKPRMTVRGSTRTSIKHSLAYNLLVRVNIDTSFGVLVYSVNASSRHGACPDLLQLRRRQELENKAAALKRELDIQRFSVQQYKDKLQQMHELLVSREQEHRCSIVYAPELLALKMRHFVGI